MIEINLIPDVKRELLKAQRQRAVVISSSITVGIVALAALALLLVYIFGAQTVRNALLDQGISDQDKNLSKVQGLSEMLTIQKQISVINKQADSRAIHSRTFEFLDTVVPAEPNKVQFSNVNINSEETSISLEGQTPRYESMEIFKKTLERAVVLYKEDGEDKETRAVSDISIAEVGYGEDTTGQRVVRFKVSFKYAEELFSSKNTFVAVAIKSDSGANVTDSRLGIKDLFTEKAKDEE